MAGTGSTAERRDRFFDGRTAAAHDVRLELEADALAIRAPSGEELARWPFAEIAVVDENAVNGGLTLTRSDGGTARLLLFEGPAKTALLAARPELLRWKWRGRARVARQTALWGGAAAVAAALLFFGWRDLTVAIAGRVPLAWEAKIGDNLLKSMLGDRKTCNEAAGKQALDGFIARIKPTGLAELDVTIDVVMSDEVNAFALPGGHVLLYSALIERAAGPQELAGVLAHELSHVELRHPARGIVQQLGLGALLNLMFGGSDLGSLGQVAALLAYSREMEAEADARATTLLQSANVDASGLASFLQSMAETDPEELPEWLSTHPDSAARAAALAAEPAGDPGFATAEWEAIRSLCAGKRPDPAAQQEPRGSASAVGQPAN
jgi:hypothetical protein